MVPSIAVDGLEMTFALNHLADLLLALLLLDALRASAPARIVNVASGAHAQGGIDFDDLQGERAYGLRAFADSKLANVPFTLELARRLEGTGVTVNALHPGFVATGFARNEGFTGSYSRDARAVPPAPAATDPVAARRLSELSAALVGWEPTKGHFTMPRTSLT